MDEPIFVCLPEEHASKITALGGVRYLQGWILPYFQIKNCYKIMKNIGADMVLTKTVTHLLTEIEQLEERIQRLEKIHEGIKQVIEEKKA